MDTSISDPPGTSGPIVSLVKQMEKEAEDQIIRLFNTAYFICKQEKTFTDYPSLIVLQEMNGLNMGNFYRSDNACRRYIYSQLINKLFSLFSVNYYYKQFYELEHA